MRELGHLRQHVGADVERLLAIDEGYGEILSITTRMHSSTVSVIGTPLEGWVRRDTPTGNQPQNTVHRGTALYYEQRANATR